MDTSENKKRVLDLVWRNYEEQLASSRRVSDRIAIVLGASVAGIGLMFKDINLNTIETLGSQVSLLAMLLSLVGGFVCACWAWVPARVGIPSGTNRDRLWHFLVAVDDDVSASTLMNDICKATEEEEASTRRLAWWLKACMVCCGMAVVASMSVKLFSIT